MNIFCPKCEAANAEDAELCSVCGWNLGGEETPSDGDARRKEPGRSPVAAEKCLDGTRRGSRETPVSQEREAGTVLCPNCKNACADAAALCPKCGMPLRRKAPPAHDEQVYSEIGSLRIVGTVMIVLGGVGVACTAVVGVSALAAGLSAIVVGILIRSMAGMWGTLERIARK